MASCMENVSVPCAFPAHTLAARASVQRSGDAETHALHGIYLPKTRRYPMVLTPPGPWLDRGHSCPPSLWRVPGHGGLLEPGYNTSVESDARCWGNRHLSNTVRQQTDSLALWSAARGTCLVTCKPASDKAYWDRLNVAPRVYALVLIQT